jgi:hypothetical protein
MSIDGNWLLARFCRLSSDDRTAILELLPAHARNRLIASIGINPEFTGAAVTPEVQEAISFIKWANFIEFTEQELPYSEQIPHRLLDFIAQKNGKRSHKRSQE